MNEPTTRRGFLATVPAAFGWIWMDHAAGPRRRLDHPEPRPGIDASLVLSEADLEGYGEGVGNVFAMIREIPHVADGIACYCGCDRLPTYRSLLTCFYAEGLGRYCPICQGEASLAHRRWKEGQSLDQIRRAIDARYA